jgi:hypothetical protein
VTTSIVVVIVVNTALCLLSGALIGMDYLRERRFDRIQQAKARHPAGKVNDGPADRSDKWADIPIQYPTLVPMDDVARFNAQQDFTQPGVVMGADGVVRPYNSPPWLIVTEDDSGVNSRRIT